jgi:hypothetical protein
MKRPFLPHLAVVTVTVLLAACQNPAPPPVAHKHPGFNGPQQPTDEPPEAPAHADATEPAKPDAETKPDAHQTPTNDTGTAPAKVGNFEYGKPVPGKPGYVTSPYAPYSGYVDVRNIPPGTEVKDPYTQKTFLVP